MGGQRMKLTRKIFSLFICLILSIAFASFSFTNRTQATNNVKWENITPKTPPLAANDGASTYQYGYNYAWDGYYLHGMTSFADLVETKSDGSKVIHFFQFMPASSFGDGYHNQYGNTYYYAKGAIVHWSSDTQVWEKISPSWFSDYWTAYGGGFSVVEESYIDPATGSMWNGRLLLHTSYDFFQTYYYYGAYNYDGQLYARMNYPYYVGSYYPGKTRVIRWDGGSNWTDLWDQTGTNSSVVPGPNGSYSQQDYRGMSSGKYFIVSYNGSVYIATFKDRYCHTYNDPTCPSYYSTPNWDLKIYQYAGSLDALLNSPSPPQAWTEVWSYNYGSRSFSYGPPAIYEFKVLNDRFFLSTSTNSYQDYAYQTMSKNGWWFVSTNNSPSTLQRGTTQGSSINAICGTIPTTTSGQYVLFPLTIPSGPYAGTYTGRINYNLWTPLQYLYPWGGGGTTYAYYFRWGINYSGHFSGRRVKITGQPNGSYFDIINMVGMYRYYSDATLWDMTTPLDEGPSPVAYEYFKNYLYAGFAKNSNLLRTNDFGNFANLSNLNTWDDCGTINDPTASPARPFDGGILALEKTTGVDEFGTPSDVALYIGGSYRNGDYNATPWNYAGTCPLYSTTGEDAGGDPDTTPLQFKLEEDEWRLNSGSQSPNFQNRMYGIYDLYDSSLGLITQFGVNSIPPGGNYTNHPEYRYRRFMLYNAPPSCNIDQDPDPVVNERGTYTSFMLTFTPTGGFGSGNVDVELTLPENIYVPTEDSGGNPINQLYFSGAIPMNGGVLNLPITIKSTNSAVVASYRNNPESWVSITDLTANITASGPVALDVIPPRPGFTVNANPSMFTLFQGECPSPTECCQDHCKQIDLDLEARNGFEDNVIIGTYWTDPPANQPEGVTFEFIRNSFVYDIFDTTGTGFTSLAEVRVRPDMGTRYAFQVRVSPDTLPGIYKFRIMFLSGSIKKQIDCTMTVLPPRPAIDVNPADGVGNFSMQIYTKEVIPGGSVRYRLKIQSKAGFTGKVALALRGLPDQVYINNPSGFEGIVAEIPVPGYAQNYVDISPTLDAYANVTLQTTPYTINPYPPTNLAVNSVNSNLNIVSWDASRRGSRPISGYEVWRSLTRYIDAANRIAVVNSPNTSYEDADVEPNTPYYYFVRAFDNDTPANFSTYATSGRVGEAASVTIVDDELDQVMATADKMGTVPGFYTLEVIGNGVGYGPGNVPTNPSAVTYLGLHVYRQDLNLKTPFLDIWGALALLFGMMLVAWQFVFRKKEEQTF
jgi:hypothetical protein